MFLQVWRSKTLTRTGSEIYTLIGQTQIDIVNGTGVVVAELKEEKDHIDVQKDDVIGIYSPSDNPIPYTSKSCFAAEETLKYNDDPGDLSGTGVEGMELEFFEASLGFDPCRSFSVEMLIGKSVV